MRSSQHVFALAVLALSLVPLNARAQQVKAGGGETITIRGFVAGTMFLQDANFGTGNGQRANYVTQELRGWWHGGDIRNTRITLALDSAALVEGWRVNGAVEIDFFGAAAADRPFGGSQPQPRLRVAYAEATNGRTAFRVGQDWSLLLGTIPVSTSHIGFPMGWGSGGFIGWRFPGLWWTQQLSPAGAATTAQVRFAVMRNTWTSPTNPDLPGPGEVGLPQMEARLDFRGKASPTTPWNLYLVGHFDRKNLVGARTQAQVDTPSNNLNGWATEAGGRIDAGKLALLGNAYIGRAMGHQFASIVQLGDIKSWGAWAQAGLTFAPRWSVWGYFGTDDPDDTEVRRGLGAGSRLKSWIFTPMLRYQAGPYALGLEWLHNQTTVATGTAPAATTTDVLDGNQILFSAVFNF